MIFVVGLDGATFDLLNPWLEAGYLPTLQRLRQQGSSGTLTSTLPPVTAAAWASFMTGKNPGQHGVFDFFRPGQENLDQFELVNSSHIQSAFFWDYLGQAGYKAGILNVPLTHPPRPLSGYLVPGVPAPDIEQNSYPPEFLAAYHQELGPYRLTPQVLYKPGREDALLADLNEILDRQINYLWRIWADHPADFFMMQFQLTDSIQHAFWQHLDPGHPWHKPDLARRYQPAIRGLFQRLDAAIGEFLAQLPDDTITIVLSDHGFGPVYQTVNLNNFLIEQGFMVLKSDWGVRLKAAAFRQGFSFALLRKILRRLQLHRLFPALGNESDSTLRFADVDWSRTRAYAMGHMGQVYVNLQGRERQGTVPPDRYKTVRQQVMDSLYTLINPETGQPMISEIVTREEAASGRFLDNGPDLHVICNDYQAIAYPMFAADGKTVTSQPHGNSGDHRREGLIILHGPAIQANHTLAQAHITDVAPTILHLLHVPVPDDMEGQVLPEALTPGFRRQHPITTQPAIPHTTHQMTLTADESDLVAERLRSLGYLGAKHE